MEKKRKKYQRNSWPLTIHWSVRGEPARGRRAAGRGVAEMEGGGRWGGCREGRTGSRREHRRRRQERWLKRRQKRRVGRR